MSEHVSLTCFDLTSVSAIVVADANIVLSQILYIKLNESRNGNRSGLSKNMRPKMDKFLTGYIPKAI